MSQHTEMVLLLQRIVPFVECETEVLETSFLDGNGDCDDPEVAVQIRQAREWLADVASVISRVA